MNDVLTNVLLATDGSEDAASATQAALDLCDRTGAGLHVVHVWQGPPSAFPAPIRGLGPHPLKEHAERVLDEQVERIWATGGKIEGIHLRMGRPAKEIAGLVEEMDADLVVVGSRGLGAIMRLTTGSISERVVRLASCPTLVVKGGKDAWPPDRIVIGDDSSDEAERVGELAARVGGLFGASALLVRAFPTRWASKDAEIANAQTCGEILEKYSESLRARAAELESLLGERPEVRVSTEDAAVMIEDIVGRSEEPTLVAVGSRGLSPMTRLVLGSVSTDVLRTVGGSVLIAPPDPDARRQARGNSRGARFTE